MFAPSSVGTERPRDSGRREISSRVNRVDLRYLCGLCACVLDPDPELFAPDPARVKEHFISNVRSVNSRRYSTVRASTVV